ncbi:MAG: helix-turn-helix domain-containing protein [Alphaproteobacteria bacterium]|nr:MAG: helix-turn-helix domain-containing protein [Alphaproteobacteria bacterium]
MLLTARQAADRLGVKLDTLYAYVSRGRLRSVMVPGTRERRYRGEDVEALLDTRSGARPSRNPDPEALMPILGSSICLIENGRFYYRGQDAVGLAESATLEEVARLLWLDQTPAELRDTSSPQPSAGAPTADGLVERCQIRLTALGDADLSALDLTRTRVIRTGRRILRELTACIASGLSSPDLTHLRLASAWRLGEAGADLLRRCLVLIADHELNPSTFVARCVASTGATPYAVVAAALSALSGRLHGGETAPAEGLLHELIEGEDPMAVMAGRLARGERLPGFGQPLYFEGDPRAVAILAGLAQAAPEAHALAVRAADTGLRLTGRHPNVDFALAAASMGLGLPRNAALGLFIIGRTVGWIAHAIEQYESGILIRPRARYMGVRPET